MIRTSLVLRELKRKLSAIANLPDNWDSYGTEPPNVLARTRTEIALNLLDGMGFLPQRVAASAESGVAISWWAPENYDTSEKYADIEFFNNGEILACISRRDGDPKVWEVGADIISIGMAANKIKEFIG